MAQKTALVIGASGGLGRAIARMLAEEGYALALVGRNVTNLEAVRNELGAAAENALILSCDLTDRAQAQAMVEQALAHLGVIDVLICAAGMNVRQRSLRLWTPRIGTGSSPPTSPRPSTPFTSCCPRCARAEAD